MHTDLSLEVISELVQCVEIVIGNTFCVDAFDERRAVHLVDSVKLLHKQVWQFSLQSDRFHIR